MPIYKICDSNNFLDRLYQGIVTRYKKSEIENLIVVLPNKNPCYYLTKKFFSKIDHGRAVYLPKIISLDEIEDLLVAKQNFLTINTDDQLIVLRVFLKREVQQSLITEQEFHAITYELSNFITKLRVDNKNLLCLQNIFLGTKNNYNKFITQSLKAIAEKWDNFLKSNNLIEAEQLRNELVKNLANDSIKLKNMILAGSTGSINSTRILIENILLNDGTFIINHSLSLRHNNNIKTHPNYCIEHLLNSLKISSYDQIQSWDKNENKSENNYLNFIFDGQFLPKNKAASIRDKFELIEAKNDIEQYLSLCIKIKTILSEKTDARIGIIINNRKYIPKLQQYLDSFNINTLTLSHVDVQATEQFKLLKLIQRYISEPFKIHNLLSILKNDFVDLKLSRDKLDEILSILECKYLRKICTYTHINNLLSEIKEEELKEALTIFAKAIEELCSQADNKGSLQKSLVSTISSLAKNPEIFWNSFEGRAIHQSLSTFSFLEQKLPKHLNFNYLDDFIEKLSKKHFLQSNKNNDCNVIIGSNVDLRLLSFTHVLIPNFNNDHFPPKKAENIISELTNIKLENDNLRESLFSYDFLQVLNADKVFILRQDLTAGKLMERSIWLERIIMLSNLLNNQLLLLDNKTVEQAKFIFRSNNLISEDYRYPSVNIDSLPKRLSVTEIEKFIRDPYFLYAKKILNLVKLKPIDKSMEQSDFGILIHKTIEIFEIKLLKKESDFFKIGKEIIDNFIANSIVQKLWISRLKKISHFYVNKFKEKNKNYCSLVERKGSIQINNIEVFAIADQLLIDNHQAKIVDFKTGSIPTKREILIGVSPQLTLEALIANNGGFGKTYSVSDLLYIQLSSGRNLGKQYEINITSDLIKTTESGLKKLLSLYLNKDFVFKPCPNHDFYPKYNDYQHLERLDIN